MLPTFVRLYAQAGFKSRMSYSEIDSRIRNMFYTVVYNFSTWFSTSVFSMWIVRLLNACFTMLNWCTASCIAEGNYRNEAVTYRFPIAACTRYHAKNRRKPVSSRPIIAKHYIFVPVLINAIVLGFSARCVTRCQDELTRTKKLESCAVERNVLYELPETWANSSLTDIPSICNAIKRPMQSRSSHEILRFLLWLFYRIKIFYYNF